MELFIQMNLMSCVFQFIKNIEGIGKVVFAKLLIILLSIREGIIYRKQQMNAEASWWQIFKVLSQLTQALSFPTLFWRHRTEQFGKNRYECKPLNLMLSIRKNIGSKTSKGCQIYDRSLHPVRKNGSIKKICTEMPQVPLKYLGKRSSRFGATCWGITTHQASWQGGGGRPLQYLDRPSALLA